MKEPGQGLISDGEKNTDETPVLVSRDLARRMSAYARLLPRRVAEENESIVLDANGPTYIVGAVDPHNFLAVRNVARALHVGTNMITTTRLSSSQFRMLIDVAYPHEKSSVVIEPEETKQQTHEPRPHHSATTAPHTTVPWSEIDPRAAAAINNKSSHDDEPEIQKGGDTRSNANFVIQEAVNRGASDIHFEPGPDCGRIRFRIDGDMYPYATDVPSARMEHLVNALADMANVNSYALPHAPCDAAINRRLALPDGRTIKTTLRFASSPALYGVDVTLRLNINQFFDFQEIGFEEQQLTDIFAALKHKNGIILVTGETGSGKSNTLEAIIRHLETGDARKVIQVGDPIEFPNPKRTQIQIRAGCDWDQALKISLRKDPNIFSPGEFRDEKEARMVFRAGRTGHLVPTTVHTNDVATTFDRLSDLSVEPYHQGPSIRLIISQQLVKKLCMHCKSPDPLAPIVAKKLLAVLFPGREDLQGMEIVQDERPWLFRAIGCPQCYGTGYRGRTVVAEVLRMTNELARMVSRGAKGDAVVDHAIREFGMMSMAEAAARKLVSGITSFNEVEHLLSEEVKRRHKTKQTSSPTNNEQPEETISAIDAEYADILTDDEWPLGM